MIQSSVRTLWWCCALLTLEGARQQTFTRTDSDSTEERRKTEASHQQCSVSSWVMCVFLTLAALKQVMEKYIKNKDKRMRNQVEFMSFPSVFLWIYVNPDKGITHKQGVTSMQMTGRKKNNNKTTSFITASYFIQGNWTICRQELLSE